jgi:hypothetical protein
MKRAALPLITLVLFAMIVADRLSHAVGSGSPASLEGPSETRSATLNLDSTVLPTSGLATAPRMAPTSGASGTPTIDRLARMAARQQLSRLAGVTYLDSLIRSTDSMVRRWPDRNGAPLRVAMIEGGAAEYRPRMAGYMREALERWEGAGLGIRFETVGDSTGADIVVRWIDRFDFDRAGQTDLTWDQGGRVRKATILLALRTNTGIRLPDAALLTVAVHEAGHALGLPHSPDSADVMFPATHTGTLSDRDRRTAQILYQLPPGSLRDLEGTR